MNTIVGVRATEAAMRISASRRARRRALSLASLVAAMLLMGLPAAAAWASSPEMRGEWTLVLSFGSQGSTKAVAVISQAANSNGEFAASSMLWEGVDPGTFTGTLGTTEASVVVTAQAFGPYSASEFTSSSMQIQQGSSSLALSGSGIAKQGSYSMPATLTATRVKTYQEIEEQHEREQREREEAEARENVRGEWSLTLQSGPQTVHGVAHITQTANASNQFASSSALFEGAVPGSFTGTLEKAKATVTITTQAAGPYPASTFTSSSITVTSAANPASMSGPGTIEVGGMLLPATLTATRTKDYQELQQLEAQEKLARETKEREAKEQLEREAREKAEKEAALKQSTPTASGTSSSSVTVSAHPAAKAFTVGLSGSLSVELANPNAFAVQVHVTLVLASSSHAGKTATARSRSGSRSKRTPLLLGSSSATIASDGRVSVKIKLTKAGRAALARHKTLAAIATIVTQASGKQRVSKAFKLTLRAPVLAHRR